MSLATPSDSAILSVAKTKATAQPIITAPVCGLVESLPIITMILAANARTTRECLSGPVDTPLCRQTRGYYICRTWPTRRGPMNRKYRRHDRHTGQRRSSKLPQRLRPYEYAFAPAASCLTEPSRLPSVFRAFRSLAARKVRGQVIPSLIDSYESRPVRSGHSPSLNAMIFANSNAGHRNRTGRLGPRVRVGGGVVLPGSGRGL